MSYTIGVDIGGTFTDCVAIGRSTGRVASAKAPTTPDDRSRGFFESIDAAARTIDLDGLRLLADCELLVHGTTTGTNAILTRTGAKVGLIATAGHGDVMYLMRGGGRSAGLPPERLLHLPSTGKPDPLVPKNLIVEVPERIDVDGDIVVSLDEAAVRAAVEHLVAEGAQAVAVSFLWAVANGAHEQRAKEIAESVAPGLFVTCGSDLTAHLGEYERTATAVMNAYVGPLMRSYVEAIERGAAARGFAGTLLFAQCAGGAMSARHARSAPIRTVNSGPVAGVGSAQLLGARIGEPHLITADMGGTSVDVSIIEGGEPRARTTSMLARYELALPTLDIASIGAGGGSIAWIDASDRLDVGPQSAGADPGPVCYGRGGTEPTVTDADVVLGYVDPTGFLGGRMHLDRAKAETAIKKLGLRIDLSPLQTAAGIVRIVESKMADLLRRVSTMRGLDPRHFACLAFGGGGPVHMVRAAREAGIPRVIVPVPRLAALWSAFGAATSDILHVHHAPLELDFEQNAQEIADVFERLEKQARERLTEEGFTAEHITISRAVTARYTRQVHSLEVPVLADPVSPDAVRAVRAAFDERYEAIVGSGAGYRAGGTTVTGALLNARGLVAKPVLAFRAGAPNSGHAARAIRSVYWDELNGLADTPVWTVADGQGVGRVDGPALIELPSTVIVVRPGSSGEFDQDGNFVITFI